MRALLIATLAFIIIMAIVSILKPSGADPEAAWRQGWDAAKYEIVNQNKTAFAASRRADEALALCRGREGVWIVGKGCDR